MSAAKPRIFISYSSHDAALVQRLKDDLKEAGASVWLDHEQLKPGTPNWQKSVREGIEQAETVICATSPEAADSQYVGHELGIARDEHKEILLVWIRGEKWSRCAPMGYYYVQNIDARDATYPDGLAKLKKALGMAQQDDTAPRVAVAPMPPSHPTPAPVIPPERFPARLAALGYTSHATDGIEWIVPPLCAVRVGPFRLGSDKQRDKEARDDEAQRITVTLNAFELARFPVTVAEYACFVKAKRRNTPANWSDQLRQLDHPMVGVTWYDAYDYAAWLTECTGQPWRLPTEVEWEKAARGDPRDPLGANSERIYPWGDTFDSTRCNTSESKLKTTSPIGWYGPDDPEPLSGRRSGASPCGAEDLAGNVWEWTASERAADYSKVELISQRSSMENRILRGGSWSVEAKSARAAYRLSNRPGSVFGNVGFRLARVALASLR